MDGVLCDFKSAYETDLKNNPRQIYPQSQYGFFLNLKPIVDAINSVNILKKNFDVWILTRPSVHNISCYSEKALWIKNYLGFEMQEKTIICTNKSLLKGDFLIDDQIEHGQSEFEGQLIRFGTEEFPDWKSVLNFFGNHDVKFESQYGC
jgi:5'(3')-deoxyribonucleotidase